MGWTGLHNDFRNNRDFYQSEIENSWNKNITPIDVSFKGNHIYQLLNKVNKDGTEEKFVAVILVERHKKDKEIRYKIVTEAEGPYVFDCPLKFLKASTCEGEYAVEWRKKCYEYHDYVKEQKEKIENVYKNMPQGTIVETVGGSQVEVYSSHYNNTNYTGYLIVNGEVKNKLYRFRFKDIKDIKLPILH